MDNGAPGARGLLVQTVVGLKASDAAQDGASSGIQRLRDVYVPVLQKT